MERKLAAIFSTDVQGYSRLMGDDEEATIRTLTAYREAMTRLIEQYRGRVVDSPGDNLLADFASAVDAVQGAVAIQEELKTRNAELPESRKMRYRIGINVGDVVVDGERIYGDGVNIAARLESLAEGGGIAISGTVHDQVKNKLSLGFTYRGEQSVKNIADPVRMYAVELETAAPTLPQTEDPPATLPLPSKPSIAVLPFTNMSGDPEQEYFSDGITDDVITDLSKISSLFVIARNSTFVYKGQAVDISEVGRKLGVRYVLEGSVRKAANSVRINVQLIDATTGGHVWADRYDRELENIFALQDEIAQKITFALKVTLTPEEQARLRQAPTTNLEAYDCFLRGEAYLWRMNKETHSQAKQLYERAIELDPEYAGAYSALAWACFAEWNLQWSETPSQSLQRAFALARQATALDAALPSPHVVLSYVTMWQKQLERARTEAEQAIALDANFAEGYAIMGQTLNWLGKPAEAMEFLSQALRLNPHAPPTYFIFLGHTHLLLGQYEDAIATLQKILARNPNLLPAHAYLAVTYVRSGQAEEAQQEAAEVRRISPAFSLETFKRMLPYQDQAQTESFLAALSQAGLD